MNCIDIVPIFFSGVFCGLLIAAVLTFVVAPLLCKGASMACYAAARWTARRNSVTK